MSLREDSLWHWLFVLADVDQVSYHELVDRFRDADERVVQRRLLEHLVRERRLTPYQANQILKDQPEQLLLGNAIVMRERPAGLSRCARFEACHRPTRHLLFTWRTPPGVPETMAKWRAQAQRSLELRHPHLDRFFGFREDAGTIVGHGEWPEGHTAAELLRKKQRLSFGQAIPLIHQAALALGHLHAAGLAHGRIGLNELIVQPGGHLKLLRDPFDGSRGVIDLDSQRPVDLAAASYLAPEFVLPQTDPDPLTDIYALGCTLYWAIVGRPPFEAQSVRSLLHEHATRRIDPVEQLVSVPDGLTQLITSMMAKHRPLRLEPISAVIAQLERFLPNGTRQTTPRIRVTELKYLEVEQREDTPREPAHVVSAPIEIPHVTTDTVNLERSRRASQKFSSFRRWRGAAAAVVGLLLLAVWLLRTQPRSIGAKATLPASPPQTVPRQHAADKSEMAAVPATPAADQPTSLWQSPTRGAPLELALMPPGTQSYFHCRLSQLLALPEGQACFEALDPQLSDAIRGFSQRVGIELTQIESILIGLSPQDLADPAPTVLLTIRSQDWPALVARVESPRASPLGVAGQLVGWTTLQPQSRAHSILLTDDTRLSEILDTDGGVPLRREFEQLRKVSDDQRLLTWLVAPHFLMADGRAVLAGQRSPLRDGLLELFGDGCQAALLSAHLEEQLYLEVRWIPTVGEPPSAWPARSRQWLAVRPERVNRFLDSVRIDPVWQPLAVRLPLMAQFVTQQVRLGSEGGSAIVNTTLPIQAGHNLVLSAELALSSGLNPSAEPNSPAATANQLNSVDQVLALATDLVVEQQSLENVLADFAAAVRERPGAAGFQIRIVGADLQLDGITRNQQIRGLDLRGQTVRQILTEVVRRANPVRVEKPSQPEQKLVWLVASRENETGELSVLITTRTAARQKGQTLPAEFVAE